MLSKPWSRTFRFDFTQSLAECQGFRLRKHVGNQQILMLADWIERFAESNKVAWNKWRSLMDHLIKRMLPICSRLTPNSGAGGPLHASPIKRDMLAVGFHLKLLQIRTESIEVLIVWKNRKSLRSQKIRIPNSNKRHKHWKIFCKWSRSEMFIHFVETTKHFFESCRSNCNHRRESDCRIHRVSPADPIPETKHICSIDSKGFHLFCIGGNRDEMLGNRGNIATECLQRPVTCRVRIGHCLERGKGFRADNEESLCRIAVTRLLCKICCVNI